MTACLNPLHLPDASGHVRIVPCGKCNACLVRMRQEWTYRLREELKVSKDAYFITLTYDNDHVPIQENIDPSTGACFYNLVVCKKDVQDFNKRFRKYLATNFDCKTRFYLISEYGPTTRRPHYHGIYFMDTVLDADSVLSAVRAAWPFADASSGHDVTVDIVTDERIKYVTEYCLTRKDIPRYLVPNFRLMSNRPGLGAAYIQRMTKWHLADETRFYVPDAFGNRCNMPRYYRDKIYSKEVRDERSADLAATALAKEVAIHSAPDFDPEKYERDRQAFIEDYNRRTNRFLNKKSKKI